MQGSSNTALGLFQRAVLIHIKGWVLLSVHRLVSSGALEESHLPVSWDPAPPRMLGDLSLVWILVHH